MRRVRKTGLVVEVKRGGRGKGKDQAQAELHFIDENEPVKSWEYAVLVCNAHYELDSIGQLYRDRADCENGFDEIKNQWGWGGYSTHDIERCALSARAVALVYNTANRTMVHGSRRWQMPLAAGAQVSVNVQRARRDHAWRRRRRAIEPMPLRLRGGYAWVPGHWAWRSDAYAWRAGTGSAQRARLRLRAGPLGAAPRAAGAGSSATGSLARSTSTHARPLATIGDA